MKRIILGLVAPIALGLGACTAQHHSAGLLAGDAPAQQGPAPAAAEDMRLAPYVEPGQLIDIGGRRINLRCSGVGGPAVVLMSGLSSWSPVWYKTQPEIARRTRVCSFDRASYGFSDPPARPQNLSDVVDDLHAVLRAANVAGPYVLVGHSLGGLEARVFAQRWPQEVAGMVIVDTSPAGEMLHQVNLPDFDEVRGPEAFTSEKLRCVLLAHGPLEASDPEFQRCLLPLPIDTPAALRERWPSFFTADYEAAQVSLMASLWTHRYDSADHVDLGDRPLVVLSTDFCCVGNSAIVGDYWRNQSGQWNARNAALARLSSRGVHRVVQNTTHMIQLDQPQAVIDAVDEVLRELPAESRFPSR